jgi:hypothetical protein
MSTDLPMSVRCRAQGKPGAETARLLCVSAAGFTPELRERAETDETLVLVDAANLYASADI